MTNPTTDQLIAHAERHGITVTWHKDGPKGAWLPHTRTISLRHNMGEPHTRCTLAHELAHASQCSVTLSPPTAGIAPSMH